MGFAPSRSRSPCQSVRKPTCENAGLLRDAQKGTCIRNFNGLGVFKDKSLGCFWAKTIVANCTQSTNPAGNPFFFTGPLDFQAVKIRILVSCHDSNTIKYQPSRPDLHEGNHADVVIFYVHRRKRILGTAITVNAWCLSRNYLKVPEVLLESFGFKGLSCPKTGEFDYNPLQSVQSMLCRSENGRVHHCYFQFDGKKRLPACRPLKF